MAKTHRQPKQPCPAWVRLWGVILHTTHNGERHAVTLPIPLRSIAAARLAGVMLEEARRQRLVLWVEVVEWAA